MLRKPTWKYNQQPGAAGALLEHALAYALRGWSIIPVIGKKPAVALWRPFQEHPADETTLRRLFSKKNITGLAVILGRVSGGLAVRDFDDAGAYHAWAKFNPVHVGTLPTVRTSRGFHVYGRLEEETFANLGDGELRADSGHYVLAPPSSHPDGPTYTWTVPLPDGPLPLLPQSLKGGQTQEQQQREDPEDPRETHNTHQDPEDPRDTPNSLVSLFVSQDFDIVRFLPTGPRQRRNCLFNLARHLKAKIPDAKPAELRCIVQQWHRLALPWIRTKPFSESWVDFAGAWECIRRPAGQSFKAAAGAADAGGVPTMCEALGYDGNLYRLTALCWQLQLQWCDRPFPLGCRKAGEFLGVSKTEAHRMLRTLQFDGVLRLVKKGTKASKKASEWHFVVAQ
jgi:hypothetical protein